MNFASACNVKCQELIKVPHIIFFMKLSFIIFISPVMVYWFCYAKRTHLHFIQLIHYRYSDSLWLAWSNYHAIRFGLHLEHIRKQDESFCFPAKDLRKKCSFCWFIFIFVCRETLKQMLLTACHAQFGNVLFSMQEFSCVLQAAPQTNMLFLPW